MIKVTIEVSKKAEVAVKSFVELEDVNLFENCPNETPLKLFMPMINGKEFNYFIMEERLSEVIIDFALNRTTKEKYIHDGDFGRLSKEARKSFKSFTQNKGELGEFLLYTLLEGHLKAPKILSKMSLKTNSADYVKGADGVHIMKDLSNSNRYHLIYGESKMYTNITRAFKAAFDSIGRFTSTSGNSAKSRELSLISSQIENEIIDDEDKELITEILYPTNGNIGIKVSDAYGIFVGFEFVIPEDKKIITENEFDDWITQEVHNMVKQKVGTIESYITENSLVGKNFYVYLMPFTDLDKTRSDIIEEVTN